MTGVTRAAAVILFAALLFVSVSWKLQLDANAELQAEIKEIHGRFEAISLEHARTMQAADDALKARDEIHKLYLSRSLQLEQALSNHPDFAGIVVPDGVRQELNAPASASGIAGAH